MSLVNGILATQDMAAFGVRLTRRRRRVLIIGTGRLATDLCQMLLSKPRGRFQIVGFLDRDPNRVGERLVNPGVVGTFGQLFEVVERYQVQTIAVCMEDRRTHLPVHTLLDFKTLGLEIVDGHRLFEEESGRLSIDLVKPSALIFSSGFQRRVVVMALKRVLDAVVASLSLLLLTPLWVALIALIKLDSPGPAIYRQIRIGRCGEPFRIYKFRSMREDAEKDGAQWAAPDDPRVTKVGRWLRKWRLDELPQLLNVVKGEMSLVGPRPERPAFVQELREAIPYYDIRHTVRPGITGWAQIRFRYGASPEDAHMKLQYDLYYVKNLSLALDLRILLESVRVVLRGEGAR